MYDKMISLINTESIVHKDQTHVYTIPLFKPKIDFQ